MSLIIKKNTTFKIPRTGSTAPAGIDVANTSAFVVEFRENFIGLSARNAYYAKNTPTSFTGSQYQLYMNYDYSWYILDYSGKYPVVAYRNTSATNPLFIPDTGWGAAGTTFFYTGTSPTIPYSTNSFVVTSAVGQLASVVGLTFTKINANTWQTVDGFWQFTGNDLSKFNLESYNGKYYYTFSEARALSSGIPTVGWKNSRGSVFTPQ